MANVNTPHIVCDKEDFAKTVLMPGDPLRAKFIAETFFTDAKLVNNVRGVNGYTGTYKGKKVSVMASGMGMPSIGIYSWELFNVVGVDTIIRIGSAGGIADDIELRDIVMGQAACSNSAYANIYNLPGTYAPICDYELLERAVATAKTMGLRYKVGNVASSDTFYGEADALPRWKSMGVLAVEMEAAALYMNAAAAQKSALCICTISDLPLKEVYCTAQERQDSFTHMMELALELA